MTVLRRWMRRATLCSAAAFPVLLPAQTPASRNPSATALATPLIGLVRDSSGHPLMGVELRTSGRDLVLARTNDDGGFRIASMPVGTSSLSLRRLGFAPATISVRLRPNMLDSLVITMAALPAVLPGVAAVDEHDAMSKRVLARFWDRRKNGFGRFMTREEIENRNATDFVDLVRAMPGVRITTSNGRPVIRFARNNPMRDCPPQYVVNGIKIENGSPDEFAPIDVEAIEIYSGVATVPVEFQPRIDSNTCGAVVIWTRLPG